MQLFFQKDSTFKEVYVKGEVSGVSISSLGHMYFKLKDKKSVVPCIIQRKNRRGIDFEIVDGMKLLVIADVSVYLYHGKYQLDIFDVAEDGLGRLYVKFQQLREKLNDEGLFNDDFKKPLPNFAKRIGVVTSKEGSVIHDIIRTINQKWPYCEILVFPSQVQGASATKQLIKQIKSADSYNLDVLIVARGGGSIEDLWSFNEEPLVRCIFNCNTPVISGIGHEGDVTLCDLVSDVSASTPTMAANFAINDKEKISNQVNNYNVRLITFMSSKIDDYKKQFNYMVSKQLFKDSNYIYDSKEKDFNSLCSRFEYNSNMLITSKKNMFNKIISSYVIRHPCKMQIDSSKAKLNELQKRLIDAADLILKRNRDDLDKTIEEFKFSSKNYLSNQKSRLDTIKNSYSIQNPCKMKLDKYNSDLDISKDKITKSIRYKLDSKLKDFENLLNRNLFRNPSLIYESKSQELNLLTNQFLNKSNEIILTNSYMLDSIKNENVIKNPDIILKTEYDNLEKIKEKQIIKNPYMILDKYNQRLDVSKQKLDKINNVLILKKEQEKQKSTYRKIIIVVVIILVIIIFILINGGI